MSEDKYQWIFEVMRQGYAEAEIVRDSDGCAIDYRILEINPAFERLVGVPVAEARGRTARELLPGIEEGWIDTFDRVVRQGKPIQFEQEIASLGRWYEVYAYPLKDDRFTALYEEITERKEQEQRRAFLLELHETISPLTDAMAVQEEAMRVLGEHLRVAWAYYAEVNHPPTHMTVRRCYTRNVPSLVGVHPISSFEFLAPLQAGESVVVPDMETSTLVSDGTRMRFGTLGMTSFAGVPITKEGVIQGCIIVADTGVRPWTDSELRLIDEAADRTWAAVQRANVEEALRESERRQGFLLKMSDALRPLEDPVQIQAIVAQSVLDYFGADRCFYGEIENDTAIVRRDASRGDLPSVAGVYPLSNMPLFKAAAQSGQPIVVPDVYVTNLLDDELKELCIQLQLISSINAPVIKNGQFVGSLCITLSTPRSWTESEVELATEIIERIWSEVERARAEAALRKSEEEFRQQLHFITAITETVPDIVSVFEYPSRKLRYVNRNPLAEQGFDADDLARMTVEERQRLIHVDDQETLLNYYAAFETLPSRAVATVEYRSKNKGGEWVWFRANGRVFEQDADGKATAFVNIIQNINERKHHEQRQAFLLKLSDVLRPHADEVEIQRAAMQLVGEFLEVDRTLYNEIRDDGETIHIEENYVRGELPKVIGDFPVRSFGAAMDVLRRGESLVIADQTTTPLKTPAEREASIRLGVLASITVPLIKEGRWVANFEVLHSSPRQWTENEIVILQETAERTWAAVERAHAEAQVREVEEKYRAKLEMEVRQRTQELRQAEEFLQTTLDRSPYIVQAFKAVRDESGKIVDFIWVFNNQAGYRQNGEVIGKSVLKRNPGVAETGLFDKFVEVTENGVFHDHEQYYNHEQFDGWFHQTLVKMGDGFVMNTEDITERKKAQLEVLRLKEELAQTAEEKYRTLFNAIDEGFCTIEVIFDEMQNAVDYRFLTMNPAFVQHTGLENAVGKTMRELVPNHEEHWFRIYGEVALTGRPVRFEEEAAALNRWYDVYAFRLDPAESHQVGVLFQDILQRKQMEDALRQANEELEQRVREGIEQVRQLVLQLTMSEKEERRRISAFLHDDLQQRLFGLGFHLMILSNTLAPEAEKVSDAQRQISQIEQDLQEAIHVTRNLSIDLSPPVLHNEGIVEALRWLASQMEQQQGLKVVIQTLESIPIINEDLRVLLFQMTRELLFNVVKHAGISRATITLSIQNGDLCIQVSDEGGGFDPGAKHATMSQGLRRLEQRLQLIGGSMQIASTPGQGTHVSLYIPLPKKGE